MKSIFRSLSATYRAATLLMSTILIISMTGCGKSTDEESTALETSNKTAMGRYMENELFMPETPENTRVINLFQDSEGSLAINTFGEEGLVRYTYNENNWDKEKLEYLDDLVKEVGNDISICDLIEKDNVTYINVLVYEENGALNRLVKIDENNNITEIVLESLDEYVDSTGYKLYKRLNGVQILDDGRIIAGVDESIVLFDENGKKEKEFNDLEGKSFVVRDNKLLATNIIGSKMSVYDLEEGKLVNEFTIFESNENNSRAYAYSDDTCEVMMHEIGDEIYLLNNEGVHKVSEDSTIIETIIDGSLNSLNRRDISKTGFTSVDGKFYALAGSGENIYLFEYIYDENVAAVPQKELSVYSLFDNATVRQAMAEFQKNNSDVRINYRVAIGDEFTQGDTDTQDYVKALNTELLAGKGADVIILDGLDTSTYIEKGVLVDISGVILDMSGELLTNITDAYKNDDKSIYCVPTKIGIPLAVGNKELLDTYCDLEKLCEFVEQNKDKRVINKETIDSLLEYCYMLYQNNIIADKKLDEMALKKLLEQIKILYDTALGGEALLEPESGMEVNVTYSLYNNEHAVAREELKSFMDLMFLTGVLNDTTSFGGINNIFIPYGQLGINSAGQVDLSKEFVKSMLSESVQSAELNNGFPINTKALETSTKKESSMSGMMSMDVDGEVVEISVEWPDEAMRKSLADIIKNAKKSYEKNEKIYKMIQTQVQDYLEQGEGTDEAAAKIIEAAKVYLAE